MSNGIVVLIVCVHVSGCNWIFDWNWNYCLSEPHIFRCNFAIPSFVTSFPSVSNVRSARALPHSYWFFLNNFAHWRRRILNCKHRNKLAWTWIYLLILHHIEHSISALFTCKYFFGKNFICIFRIHIHQSARCTVGMLRDVRTISIYMAGKYTAAERTRECAEKITANKKGMITLCTDKSAKNCLLPVGEKRTVPAAPIHAVQWKME